MREKLHINYNIIYILSLFKILQTVFKHPPCQIFLKIFVYFTGMVQPNYGTLVNQIVLIIYWKGMDQSTVAH